MTEPDVDEPFVPSGALPPVIGTCACHCGGELRGSASDRPPRFLVGHKAMRGLPLAIMQALEADPCSGVAELAELTNARRDEIHHALEKPRRYGWVERRHDPRIRSSLGIGTGGHVYWLTERGAEVLRLTLEELCGCAEVKSDIPPHLRCRECPLGKAVVEAGP